MRDLFADEHEHGVWFEDPALLEKLALAKLRAAADELATRWKWAVPMIEAAWSDTARYGRIHPRPGKPTGAEAAETGRLEARQAELAELDDGEWTDARMEEAGRLETRQQQVAMQTELENSDQFGVRVSDSHELLQRPFRPSGMRPELR